MHLFFCDGRYSAVPRAHESAWKTRQRTAEVVARRSPLLQQRQEENNVSIFFVGVLRTRPGAKRRPWLPFKTAATLFSGALKIIFGVTRTKL